MIKLCKILLILGIITGCSSAPSDTSQSTTTKTSGDKDIGRYTLEANSFGYEYIVSINDIEISSTKKFGKGITQIPINEWLISGENQIKINATASEDASDDSTISLRLYHQIDNQELDIYKYKKTVESEKSLNEVSTFKIDQPLLEGSLLNQLPTIDPNDEKIIEATYELAQMIYTLFETEKKDELLSIFKRRQIDISKSYTQSADTHIKTLENSLNTVFESDDFEILNFTPDKLSIKTAFSNKLITIEYADYNVPFVNFSNVKDREVLKSFPIYFGMDKNSSKLFVCR